MPKNNTIEFIPTVEELTSRSEKLRMTLDELREILKKEAEWVSLEKEAERVSLEETRPVHFEVVADGSIRVFVDEDHVEAHAVDIAPGIERDAERPNPPSSALVSSLLPIEVSEDLIANLNELFEAHWVPRHGVRVARRIWRAQAALIIVRRWAEPLLSFVLRLRGMAQS